MNDPIDSTEKLPTQVAQIQAIEPGLYLVPTPIGNLRDITLRGLDVLGGVDAVVCEDSRVTGKLMQLYGLKKKLIVYNDHSEDYDRDAILARLEAGESLALVSDAGTPLVSDPGYKLVHAVQKAGIAVYPLPGASAVLPALQVSALPSDKFLFLGFLPHKSSGRRAQFIKLKDVPVTMVFYESPNRIADSVVDAHVSLGDRPAAIVRELTKIYEEVHHGTLAGWAAQPDLMGTLKGEIVFLIAGAPKTEATEDDIRNALVEALETLSVKDAAAAVSDALNTSKKPVYDMALEIKNGKR